MSQALFKLFEILTASFYLETHPVILPAERSEQIPREWIRDSVFIPQEYRETLRIAAERYRINFQVFARLGYSESWLDPKAIRYHKGSKYRDLGMWQFNEKWLHAHFAELGRFDPMDVEQSTEKAAKKLKRLYLYHGSWYHASMSYKCGIEGSYEASDYIQAVCRWIAEGIRPWYKVR